MSNHRERICLITQPMKILLPTIALLFLASCAVHPVTTAVDHGMELPETFSEASGPLPEDHPWWHDFECPGLSALMDEVLSRNLDLRQGWARISQAEAMVRQAGGATHPRLSLEALAGQSRSYPPVQPVPLTTEDYGLSLSAAYEVDLWGRLSSQKESAGVDLEITRLDLQTMMITISGEVTRSWFVLAAETMRLALTLNQMEANRINLDLIELRYSLGLASSLDLYRQRRELAALEAMAPLIEARIDILQRRLAILSGRSVMPPVIVPEDLPELRVRPRPGIPSDLLERRPDVEAARLNVVAADHRVAAAVADLFPRVTISAARGYRAASFADLFDRAIWSITGSMIAHLYDGDARKAEVDRRKALVEERLSAYRRTVLVAVAEVEDALVSEDKQKAHLEKLEVRRAVAKETEEAALRRYLAGLVDYLVLLDAQQARYEVDRAIIDARLQLVLERIHFYRSLGGTWPDHFEGNLDEG